MLFWLIEMVWNYGGKSTQNRGGFLVTEMVTLLVTVGAECTLSAF